MLFRSAEARNIARADASIKEGGWRKDFPGARIEIGNSTVGMVGFGHVGRAMASKLQGFNPTILAYDPYAKAEDLKKYNVTKVETIEEVFKNSDFVLCQARLSPETERFINKRLFELMKPSAYFINVSRSRLVNQQDLVDVLKAKDGRGLDARLGKIVNMIDSGIIDPAKVTRNALQNAASIAGLLLTTESLIVDKQIGRAHV